MDRRTFFKIAGLGGLSAAAAGCSNPEKTLHALVGAPDDMVVGKGSWYAGTCRECPAGCGTIVKTREGRAIKVEGNPLHPVNRGKLCMRGQAALQGVYNPDRIKTPLLKKKGKWKAISLEEARVLVEEKSAQAGEKGENRTRLLSEVVGETEFSVMAEFLKAVNAGEPVLFETLSYDALKAANRDTLGVDGLPSYRMDKADVLVSFGADFLETFLSPVEYAAAFKAMHGLSDGKKGLFFHVSPFQSLTAANADKWIAVKPSGEGAVLLGLLAQAREKGRGEALPGEVKELVDSLCAPFTRERVLVDSGIDPALYDALGTVLLEGEKPLVLGQSAADTGDGYRVNVAANLLNMVLDPELSLLDFAGRHRVETAATRAEIHKFFESLKNGSADLLFLNNVNPAYALPTSVGVGEILENKDLFTVNFTNFMDETAEASDLLVPVALAMESWGEYGGKFNLVSTNQPLMKSLYGAPVLSDFLMSVIGESEDKKPFRGLLFEHLVLGGLIQDKKGWAQVIQKGGIFDIPPAEGETPGSAADFTKVSGGFLGASNGNGQGAAADAGYSFAAVPSIRFFDGRGANRPWLCEYPDAMNKVAWQSPLMGRPETFGELNIKEGDLVRVETKGGAITAPAYFYHGIRPALFVLSMGQGHTAMGRYAKDQGANPLTLLPAETAAPSGAASFMTGPVSVKRTGKSVPLARTDGSKFHHDRKIVPRVTLAALENHVAQKPGLTMDDFPITLPTPEGYDPTKDSNKPHRHVGYRWSMAVDMDRCIGCGACSIACYAENNLGVVGEEMTVQGREMPWLSVERYHERDAMDQVTFLPLMCQHCDTAPCESVCPVYAPHHSKEGLNNQIYNRCIGTRYCSQNCPYKVRRFNWFDVDRPKPLELQFNPEVTVRSKGVMEKCSFCVQRIKEAHNRARNEKRGILDGEILPACMQSCPTGALMAFGNVEDKESRVRKAWEDPRAYQILGYLNTKTAVVYLKKIVREI